MIIDRVPRLLPTSLLVAGLAYLSPRLTELLELNFEGIWISMGLALVWFAITAFGMARSGKQWFWFLIGLPFAAYWPFWIVMLSWACARDIRACP